MSATCGYCLTGHHLSCPADRWLSGSGGKPWACDCDHPSHQEGK